MKRSNLFELFEMNDKVIKSFIIAVCNINSPFCAFSMD